MPPTGRGGPRTAGLAARGRIPTVPQVVIFYTITFAFSWALFLPYVFGVFSIQREEVIPLALGVAGPTISALVLTGIIAGRPGLRGLWRQAIRWRVGAAWYAIVLVGPGLVYAAALAVGVAFGVQPAPLGLWLPALANGLLAGLFEEFGWSGFAFPALQARYGFGRAGAAVGVLLAFWHLPFFFIPELPHYTASFALFLAAGIAVRILFGSIYNGTGGSLLFMFLFHASLNTWAETLSIGTAVVGPVELSVTTILWFAALCVLLLPSGMRRGSQVAGR